MKKILVVGGSGFIGHHICKSAIKKKYDVYSLSSKRPTKKRFIKKVKYLLADLKNKKKLSKFNYDYDYVVNCSGHSYFPEIKKEKINLQKNHYYGMLNLVNLLNKKRLKKFIQIGSSMEYGAAKSPLSENTKCKPNNFYGRVKLRCTNFLLKKFKSEKFPCVILRVFQVYGPSQSKNKIIPYVALNCKKNSSFNLSKGTQLRDFLFINDLVVSIFKTIGSRRANGKIINIGYGKPIMIKFLVNYIKSIIKKGNPKFGGKTIKHNENSIIYPEIKLAKKILDWAPITRFEHGIKLTIREI